MRWLLLPLWIGLAACNEDKISQLEKQNKELTERLATLEANSRQAAALDVQAKCAKQAEVVYKSNDYPKTELSSYTNHYNAKLNKCFVEITDMPEANGTLETFITLMDAFEGKDYGDYFGKNRTAQCKVVTPNGQDKNCDSRDEFDLLVKPYMEE
jgi:hypothetical protein